MLSFVKNLLGPKANPIGVDFGSDSVKLAQVARAGGDGEWRLVAAAAADVPTHARHNAPARMEFLAQPEQPLLDSQPKRRLEQELGDCRGVDNDHCESRSRRMTSAAEHLL